MGFVVVNTVRMLFL